MKTYKQIDRNTIQIHEQVSPDTYTSGAVVRGRKAKRQVQDGFIDVETGELDEEGNPITESVPNMVEEEYEPWLELPADEVAWMTEEELVEKEKPESKQPTTMELFEEMTAAFELALDGDMSLLEEFKLKIKKDK